MPRSTELAQRVKFIYSKADEEARGLYKTERAEVSELLDSIEGQKKIEARYEQIAGDGSGSRAGDGSGRLSVRTPDGRLSRARATSGSRILRRAGSSGPRARWRFP